MCVCVFVYRTEQLLQLHLPTMIHILINFGTKLHQHQNDFLFEQRRETLNCLINFNIYEKCSRYELRNLRFTLPLSDSWSINRKHLFIATRNNWMLNKQKKNTQRIENQSDSQQIEQKNENNDSIDWEDGKKFHNGLQWFIEQNYELNIINSLLALLKEYYGVNHFRKLQKEAILACCEKKNVIAVLPTGHGKSLIYILASCMSIEIHKKINNTYEALSVTIIVSPLISLINDQISKLQTMNLSAISLAGPQLLNSTLSAVGAPKYQFVFITPERFVHCSRFTETLLILDQNALLDRIVIDEAHCINMWGFDFRKSYSKLKLTLAKFKSVPILALTATATISTISKIITALNMPSTILFRTSMCRPNLKFIVIIKKGYKNKSMTYLDTPLDEIKDEIKNNESGIIYCPSPNEVNKVSACLDAKNINNVIYYSAMNPLDKKNNYQEWICNDVTIIVATSALGMGIDKSDVTWIIHTHIGTSITDMFQKSGRAGRNGKPAKIICCFALMDRFTIQSIIRNKNIKDCDKFDVFDIHISLKLSHMWLLIAWHLNTIICRNALLMNHFDEVYDYKKCKQNCDIEKKYHKSKNLIQINVQDVVYKLHSTLSNWDKLGRQHNRSFNILTLILKGSSQKQIFKYHDDKTMIYGLLKKWDKQWVMYLLAKLLADKYLQETHMLSPYRGYVSYIVSGSSAMNLTLTSRNYYIRVPKEVYNDKPQSRTKSKSAAKKRPKKAVTKKKVK